MPERERCALCQVETEVERETPCYERRNFIDSAGQLCPECYEVISVNKVWHNLM
jgi:hypothetical protein